MTGCTETAVIVNFFLDLIQLFLNSIFSDWYLCTQSIHLHSAGCCLLITSSCSLMRSACGPDSKATSMTLMWGQETAIAITSWAQIHCRTYGRHFREENRSRVARKNSDAGLQCHHAPRPWKHWHHLINGDAFRVSGGHMCPWSQIVPEDEDAFLACELFHHSESGSAFPCDRF